MKFNQIDSQLKDTTNIDELNAQELRWVSGGPELNNDPRKIVAATLHAADGVPDNNPPG